MPALLIRMSTWPPAQLDGLSGDRTGARSVAKIGRDEIGFAARCSYFGNRLFTAFQVAAHDHPQL
jgi:hypothetical protein